MPNFIFVVIALFTLTQANTVYADNSETLKTTILGLDKKMFDAFNSCDIASMFDIFDQDLEFYHDQGGLTDYQQNLKVITNNCKAKLGLTRTLLPEYNAIFPAGSYGAIQEGRHQFCHIENGVNDCGTFKFVHIWKKSGERWTITRVISYDH